MRNLRLEMAAVFLASTQAALFGPSKQLVCCRSCCPNLSSRGAMVYSNWARFWRRSWEEFLAPFWRTTFTPGKAGLVWIFLILSLIGLSFSLGITKVPAANPSKKFQANPVGGFWAQGRLIRKDRVLWLAVLGNTYFWFLAMLLTGNILFYGTDVLHISPTKTGLLSGLSGDWHRPGQPDRRISFERQGRIRYRSPLVTVGMTVFGILLSGHGLSFNHVLGLLAALGFSAGFFAVPVNALIQHRPDEKDKGGVIAAANLLSWVGIGAASGVYYVFQHYLHFSPPVIFLAASLMTVAATGYVLYLLPDALLCCYCGSRRTPCIESICKGASMSRPRAERCSSLTTFRWWTRCC